MNTKSGKEKYTTQFNQHNSSKKNIRSMHQTWKLMNENVKCGLCCYFLLQKSKTLASFSSLPFIQKPKLLKHWSMMHVALSHRPNQIFPMSNSPTCNSCRIVSPVEQNSKVLRLDEIPPANTYYSLHLSGAVLPSKDNFKINENPREMNYY